MFDVHNFVLFFQIRACLIINLFYGAGWFLNEQIQDGVIIEQQLVDDNILIYINFPISGGIKEFAQNYDNLVLDKTEKSKDSNSKRIGSDLLEQTSKLNIETTMELLSIPITKILPFLYLGNSKDAENEKVLDDNNIRLVLNLTCNCQNHFSSRNDIKYKQVRIEDSCKENILGVLLDSLAFIGRLTLLLT